MILTDYVLILTYLLVSIGLAIIIYSLSYLIAIQKADSEKVYKIILKTPLTDLEKERIYFYTYHYDSINSPTIYNISERFDLDFIGWNNFNDVLLCKKI
jgi:hypothetical protein